MELDTFIEKSLVSICNGIKRAKKSQNIDNEIIAPKRNNTKIYDEISVINFEVQVSVNDRNELQVCGGLACKGNIPFVAKAEGNVILENKKSGQNSTTHKISFSVPITPILI